jgi:23S rRNA (pseudouridine1915-N3)-methyltransferase
VKIEVAAVGRLKPGPLLDLQRDYAKRIRWPLSIREVEEKRKLAAAELKEREGALLLAGVPETAVAVALDERGAALSSAAFAEKIRGWRDRGADVVFLLGGADGHADTVRGRADLLLAFGTMTWPHLLARVMLLEQLYRAQQILAGHPYHRG